MKFFYLKNVIFLTVFYVVISVISIFEYSTSTNISDYSDLTNDIHLFFTIILAIFLIIQI